MRYLVKRVKLLFILCLASVLLLTTGCVQVEVSGIPTEHYLIVQPPADSTQILDCTSPENASDLASTTELSCHPIALTIRR